MPNWCMNDLLVQGPKEDVNRFVEDSTKGEGFFDSFYPTPESLTEVEAGSRRVAYDIVHGTIPAYVWGWDWVKESGIDKNSQDAREQLINLCASHDKKNIREMACRVLADKYKHNIETHGHLDWYEWRLEHWGTKWDVGPGDMSGFRLTDESHSFRFDTAWSPPEPWLMYVSELKRYKALTFILSYEEPGMGFGGSIKVSRGVVLKSTSTDVMATDLHG